MPDLRDMSVAATRRAAKRIELRYASARRAAMERAAKRDAVKAAPKAKK